MQSPAAGTKQLRAIAWANWIEISFVGKDHWILVSNKLNMSQKYAFAANLANHPDLY